MVDEPDPRTLVDAPGTLIGPEVRPANRSIDAAGSIHDDTTAAQLGFRGGTVAGNAHLDHFGSLLVERFGPSWFEHGTLSMYFRAPTTHLEPVRAFLGPVGGDGTAVAGVMDGGGAVVAVGDATGRTDVATALDRRDRHALADHSVCTLVGRMRVGDEIDAGTTAVSLERQRALLADPHLLTAPLDWYRDTSPWGPAIACPSVMVDTLWAPFERCLASSVEASVGMYGAIEVRHLNGPLLAGATYRLSGIVETISASPRSEIFWARTTATDDTGRPVASLLMMIRLLQPHTTPES